MATYTQIQNSEIDQDSPVNESLMYRLRDNPEAIAEGATGAPRNTRASLNSDLAESVAAIKIEYDQSLNSVLNSKNVTSVTDLGTGSCRVNFAITMSDTGYTVVATPLATTGSSQTSTAYNSKTTTSVNFVTVSGRDPDPSNNTISALIIDSY